MTQTFKCWGCSGSRDPYSSCDICKGEGYITLVPVYPCPIERCLDMVVKEGDKCWSHALHEELEDTE